MTPDYEASLNLQRIVLDPRVARAERCSRDPALDREARAVCRAELKLLAKLTAVVGRAGAKALKEEQS